LEGCSLPGVETSRREGGKRKGKRGKVKEVSAKSDFGMEEGKEEGREEAHT
jgi:hypothetical protein